MAGRGSKPAPLQRQTGQGNPPVAKPSPMAVAQPGKSVPATASAQQGKTHVPANNGRVPTGAARQARETSYANSYKHHSRWGDDGFCGYGEGYHRGGASARGGRGQAWQNDGNAGNGFNVPPGQFVPGPSGPSHPKRGGFRQNWIGRGGGRKPRPPIAAPEQPADPNVSSMVTVTETVKEVADSSLADQSLIESPTLFDVPDSDKDTHMTDGDDASGSKDNTEGSKDTGPNDFPKQTTTPQQNQPHPGTDTGPNNTILHRDLRFGAFDPASAPAKIGSWAESPSLPRFARKTSRNYKGSVQSKSALKPLSLEEYLVGAKATSTTLPIVLGAPVTSTSAGLMEDGTADGLGPPTCQPQVADLSQCTQLLADEAEALIGHAAAPARVEEAAHPGLQCSVVPGVELPASVACLKGVSVHDPSHVEVAAVACGGAVATAGAVQTTPCAAQPHEGAAQISVMNVLAPKLAMHEDFTAGEDCVSTVPRHAPVAAQVASVEALASVGGVPTGAALVAAQPDDVEDVYVEGPPMAGTECIPTAVAPESGPISVDDVIAFGGPRSMKEDVIVDYKDICEDFINLI
ncbi:hypothetical protein D1007_13021 [Hordeum vulgare]|nr:hypothetical protein D1007_13021 [Hordeum vulgare]